MAESRMVSGSGPWRRWRNVAGVRELITGTITNPGIARLWIPAAVGLVLASAAVLGARPSLLWLVLPCLGIGASMLVQRPAAGVFALVPAALLLPVELGTGSEVSLNLVTALLPGVFGVWLLDALRRGDLRFARSGVNGPLLLFLAAGLLSLAIGRATWDPAVHRSSAFIIVQVAQWAIFAFSGLALWLTGNLITDAVGLRRLVFLFLGIGGIIAIPYVVPAAYRVISPFLTTGVARAPFWMMLVALGGGQLLFNRDLHQRWRIFLVATMGAVAVYVFHWNRATASYWISVVAVVGVLGWLRWPRLRWPVMLLLVVLAVGGGLFSTVFEFAGGESEWSESGGSRLALIGRVVEVTMRNPITGLGPAAYRPYAAVEPLLYFRAYWVAPQINSHNNYVDLFSQTGLLGLALFLWFSVEVARLGLRLRARFAEGFCAGYVNGMLAACAASLVLMMLADWILPFVYNIGFPGFQSSVLVWLFVGGLLALDQRTQPDRLGS